MFDRNDTTRRSFLLTTALAGLGLAATDASGQGGLTPTPACGDGPTVRQTEGPFYKPRSPERVDLREPGMGGRAVELSGLVLHARLPAGARALVDLWHADDKGDYDDRGFRCRGHVYTDAEGRYRFRTIVPAVYPGRTRHYHVKVQAPGSSLLTTQLYFPDEAANRRDGLFRRELVMRVAPAEGGMAARFDFVLDLS